MPKTRNLKPILNNPYPEPLNLKAKSSTLSPRPSALSPEPHTPARTGKGQRREDEACVCGAETPKTKP